jgi:hypothetical protein
MHSTLKPRQTDDPHDIVVVAPDPVPVAPADEELSKLLHQAAARFRSDTQTRASSDVAADPTIPPVDTTFRPTVNDVLAGGKSRSMGKRAVRAFTALVLAACIGGAGMAWRYHGDAAKLIIAKWTPQFIMTALLAPEKPAPATQPAVPIAQADAANAVPPQPARPAQAAAAETVAPPAASSSDSAQLLQSMARDLASAGQEIEQLKASVEQLKASQQQMSRDLAKASDVKASDARASEIKPSEQNLRPRRPAPPPRSAAAPVRQPLQPYPPRQAVAAPALPPSAAPYPPPRQLESQPQTPAEPPAADPELASVPRPPMPLR